MRSADLVSEGGGGQSFNGVQAAASHPVATVPWPYVERRAVSRRVPEQRVQARDHAVAVMDGPTSSGRGRERGSWKRRTVWMAAGIDASAGFAGAALALTFDTSTSSELHLAGLAVAPLLLPAAVAHRRGYGVRVLVSAADSATGVLKASVAAAVAVAVVSLLLATPLPPTYLALAWTGAALVAVLGRAGHARLLTAARRRGRCAHAVLLAGAESSVIELVRQIAEHRAEDAEVRGACVPGGASQALARIGVPVLGDLHEIASVVNATDVDSVAVAPCEELHGPRLRRLAWQLEGCGADLVIPVGPFHTAPRRLRLERLSGMPLVHLVEPTLSGGRQLVKSALDRVLALLVLVAISPLLLLIAVAVRATSPGPALYRQQRVGRNGRAFTMWKFRSMSPDADRRRDEVSHLDSHAGEVLFKVREDPRVTPLGRKLRRWSLDELPQLFNVLRGEMSLVGPRPPLPGEVARYGDGVQRRLLVKPGVTGLWQVCGRSDLTWEQSVQLDLRYVEEWSLALDARIMVRTLLAVLRGRGAY